AVERLEQGQLLGVLLDQVGELEHEPAALGGVHLGPGALLQGGTGGLDGLVDVGSGGGGDLGADLAGGGGGGVEGLAGARPDPVVVDEQARFLDGRGGRALLRRRRHGCVLSGRRGGRARADSGMIGGGPGGGSARGPRYEASLADRLAGRSITD